MYPAVDSADAQRWPAEVITAWKEQANESRNRRDDWITAPSLSIRRVDRMRHRVAQKNWRAGTWKNRAF